MSKQNTIVQYTNTMQSEKDSEEGSEQEYEIVEELALSRYLYDRYEIKQSLLMSILQRDKDQALFWVYELYYSGWEECAFTYLILICNKLFYELDWLSDYMELQYDLWKGNPYDEIIGNGVCLLCSLDYSLVEFAKSYFSVEVKKMARYKSLYNKQDIEFMKEGTLEKYKTVVCEDCPRKTLSSIKGYSSHHEYQELFGHGNNIGKAEYNSWIMHASKSPLWKKRIEDCNGVVDLEKNTVFFQNENDEDLFYNKWNFEIDEQSVVIQEQRYVSTEKEIKQVFLKDFLKLFGYTLSGSKKKKLTCKVSK